METIVMQLSLVFVFGCRLHSNNVYKRLIQHMQLLETIPRKTLMHSVLLKFHAFHDCSQSLNYYKIFPHTKKSHINHHYPMYILWFVAARLLYSSSIHHLISLFTVIYMHDFA